MRAHLLEDVVWRPPAELHTAPAVGDLLHDVVFPLHYAGLVHLGQHGLQLLVKVGPVGDPGQTCHLIVDGHPGGEELGAHLVLGLGRGRTGDVLQGVDVEGELVLGEPLPGGLRSGGELPGVQRLVVAPEGASLGGGGLDALGSKVERV